MLWESVVAPQQICGLKPKALSKYVTKFCTLKFIIKQDYSFFFSFMQDEIIARQPNTVILVLQRVIISIKCVIDVSLSVLFFGCYRDTIGGRNRTTKYYKEHGRPRY